MEMMLRDSIVALGNGQIIEQGSYFDLMKDTGEVKVALKVEVVKIKQEILEKML